jgi:uncharacterized membrane protein
MGAEGGLGGTGLGVMDPGLSVLALLACGLGGLLLFALLAWLGVLLVRGGGGDGLGRARSLLHRRLAAGEIDVEEYYERESVLRQATPTHRRRFRG